MNIIISNSSDKPIYQQIVLQIKNAIMDGTLSEGDPLPSMRFLAKELRISVITTKRAYEELDKEGFIETVQGKGCFVSKQNLELIKESQLYKAQELLHQASDIAKSNDISLSKLIEILTIIYEED